MYVVIPTESSFLQVIKLRQNYADAVNDRKPRLVPQPRVTNAASRKRAGRVNMTATTTNFTHSGKYPASSVSVSKINPLGKIRSEMFNYSLPARSTPRQKRIITLSPGAAKKRFPMFQPFDVRSGQHGFKSARSSQLSTAVRRMSCGSAGISSTSWKAYATPILGTRFETRQRKRSYQPPP